MSLQIVIVRPPDFIHTESWREAIEAMHHGLAELGVDAPIRENRIEPGATTILFGAHHLVAGQEANLPPDTILYNLEQLLPGYPWYQKRYLELLQRLQVWDFSSRNVEHLRATGINPSAIHVPVGYVPQLSRIPPADEDVDVLFFGLMSARRKAALDALAAQGLKVVVLNGVFGEERDRWIARARVVLNLRYTEGGLFESLRVLYLLANRKAVVSEIDHGEIPEELRAGMLMTSYEGLVNACTELVHDPARRAALAEAGFRAASSPQRRMSAILRCLVGT